MTSKLVFGKNLDRIQATFLRSGHTHEDVDATFSQLSRHLLKCRDHPDTS